MRFSIFGSTLRIIVLSLALCASLGTHAAKKYEYFPYPDASPAAVSVPKPTYPTAVLMGGSYDVDEAFRWMIQKSGGGNFVVIRASGTDAYNPYIYDLRGSMPLTSVETLIIPSREAANDPFVLAKVAGAEAIWIAGGDQSDYYNFWKDTELEKAINVAAKEKNIPIGGTSAGLMVLPMIGFTAINGGITSSTALSNPFDKSVVLGKDFLDVPYLGQTYNGVPFPRNLITDAHLSARGRMGRLLTFMARMIKDGLVTNSTARAIGVDEETALLVENGVGSKTGKGFVYFLQGVGQPAVCEPKWPLSFYNVGVQRLKVGGKFDLNNWATNPANADSYSLSVTSGVLSSTQANGSEY